MITNEQKLECYKIVAKKLEQQNYPVCILLRRAAGNPACILPTFTHTNFPEVDKWITQMSELYNLLEESIRSFGLDIAMLDNYMQYNSDTDTEDISHNERKEFVNQQIKELEAICKR